MDDVLLVCLTEKRTAADIDRLAEVLAEVGGGGMKLIYEKSRAGPPGGPDPRPGRAGRRGAAELARAAPPRLPELAEPELVRHYTELSTRTFGIDTGFYPLGSCTMKYNPRVTSAPSACPASATCIRYQEDEGAQGALELMWRLQEMLAEVAGLDAVTLQPAAGAQGELTGLTLMRAYFADRGEDAHRGPHPRHRPRHQPGQRGHGGLHAGRA